MRDFFNTGLATLKLIASLFISIALVACKSYPSSPAPVVDISTKSEHAASSTKSTPSSSTKSAPTQEKDWRPDLYVVKKGDTLFSIGLEHGFDYKEIAQDNQIEPPYTIKIGQTLKLKNLKSNEKSKQPERKVDEKKSVDKKSDEEVVTKPLQADTALPQGKPLNEPIVGKPLDDGKANTATIPAGEPSNAAQTTTTQNPSTIQNPANTADINDKLAPQSRTTSRLANSTPSASLPNTTEWSWPTKGKVVNPFNESSNAKGIDIEGVMGQEINAAGSGKVIYNGADLRGYGNMVIIKHDKDYLSVYAHNSKSLVKEGQQINKGQKIAEMGNSGTDKVKLHFEIRFQGKSVDPMKYLGNLNPQ